MTGYGYKEWQNDSLFLSVEIKGYNSRFLETFVNLPPFLSSIESKIKELTAESCKRGKVEINVRLKELNSDMEVSINLGAAKAYYEAMETLSQTLKMNDKPSLKDLLALDGVLQIDKKRDNEKYWLALEPLVKDALSQFDTEREREGNHTKDDIFFHLDSISKSREVIQSYAPQLEKDIEENLRAKIEEYLSEKIDENRILQETAILLMKYTISEELSRLDAHLKEFREELERNPAPGKKLDFLSQEINREINTIGSKSPVLEVNRCVVSMKDALENIREQLRNVE
ncbi:MAG: YicC family protein [Treponema sp.]|jgi:uncharacterized protein (TIGR00255 family)|nr:YicC family protein [Treponema sp.]